MNRRLEVGLDRFSRGKRRLGRVEGLDGQQGIDGGRLGLGFGEAVALGERALFQDADAIDEAVEVLPEPSIGASAVGRLEQDIERAVEFAARPFEVPERQFLLASREVTV